MWWEYIVLASFYHRNLIFQNIGSYQCENKWLPVEMGDDVIKSVLNSGSKDQLCGLPLMPKVRFFLRTFLTPAVAIATSWGMCDLTEPYLAALSICPHAAPQQPPRGRGGAPWAALEDAQLRHCQQRRPSGEPLTDGECELLDKNVLLPSLEQPAPRCALFLTFFFLEHFL